MWTAPGHEPDTTNSTEARWSRLKRWWPAAVALAVTIAVRAWVHANSALIPGVDGAYYPYQVRALLTGGRLAESDLPLTFLLQAALARVLTVRGIGAEAAALTATKIADTMLPAAVILPLFALMLRWGAERPLALPGLAVASLVALSASPLRMIGDLQKNSLGMVLLACAAWALHAALDDRDSGWRWALLAGFVAASAMTHVGALAATLIMIAVGLLAGLAGEGWPSRRALLLALASTTGVMLGGVGWFALGLPGASRLRWLAGLAARPLQLFEGPTPATLFGQAPAFRDALLPSQIQDHVALSALALVGLVLVAARWKTTPAASRAVVAGASACTLVLASPFIGAEWAWRLLLMAYLPASIVIAYALLNVASTRAATWASAALLALVLLGLPGAVAAVQPAQVTQAELAELQDARPLVSDPDKTLVIARHGLEWWCGWALDVRATEAEGLDPAALGGSQTALLVQRRAPEGGSGATILEAGGQTRRGMPSPGPPPPRDSQPDSAIRSDLFAPPSGAPHGAADEWLLEGAALVSEGDLFRIWDVSAAAP